MSQTSQKSQASTANGKLVELRERMSTALDSGKQSIQRIGAEAGRRAKQADKLVRKHPYPALGIAAGVGAIVGVVAARRFSKSR